MIAGASWIKVGRIIVRDAPLTMLSWEGGGTALLFCVVGPEKMLPGLGLISPVVQIVA